MLARHPRGFKQAMVYLAGFVAFLVWTIVDLELIPPDRLQELQVMVDPWIAQWEDWWEDWRPDWA